MMALHQIKKRFFLKQEENNTKDNLVAFYVTDLLTSWAPGLTDKQRLTISYKGYKGILGYNVGNTSIIGNTCMLNNPEYDFYMDVNFRGNFSLRSNNKLDVSEMAAHIGNGGGHPNASGGKHRRVQRLFCLCRCTEVRTKLYSNDIRKVFLNQDHAAGNI